MKKLSCLLLVIGVLLAATAAAPDYQSLLNQVYIKYNFDHSGKNADYIPALAKYNPNLYGIALVTVAGKVYTVGDSAAKFPLESIAKIFALALVLQQQGADVVLHKLGANATGAAFNSVMAIEQQPNRTGNPLVNAGALATVSLIAAENAAAKWELLQNNLNNYADMPLLVNQEAYQSEMATNQHNQAIAMLLQSYGHFYGNINETVALYARECSVEASVVELAKMGSVLANHGKSPFTGKQLLNSDLVAPLLAEMATAGMYDASGSWLYLTGIPAKSGVSGAIIAIVPGKFAIAVYAPPLDVFGNSVRGEETIEYIAKQTQSNIFGGN